MKPENDCVFPTDERVSVRGYSGQQHHQHEHNHHLLLQCPEINAPFSYNITRAPQMIAFIIVSDECDVKKKKEQKRQ